MALVQMVTIVLCCNTYRTVNYFGLNAVMFFFISSVDLKVICFFLHTGSCSAHDFNVTSLFGISYQLSLVVNCRNIKESSNRLAAMAAVQSQNKDLKQMNIDLHREVASLRQKIEEFNKSVGDEVPELINKHDETKAKLRAEQASSDTLREEVRLDLH